MKTFSVKYVLFFFTISLILIHIFSLLFVMNDSSMEDRNTIILSISLASILATVGLGYQLLERMLFNPLREMSEKLERMAIGDYNQRIQFSYKNELTVFSATLNILFQKFSRASAFVKELGNGNLDYKMEEFEKDHHFAEDSFIQSLLATQSALKENSIEGSRSSWIAQGVTHVEDLLRKHNQDITELSNQVITSLVKSVGANQGGIFLLNFEDKDEEVLELQACFAYDRKKFLEKKIRIGEGLVGQVAIEKEAIYLTDVPHGYTTITSGLGDATPSAIFIVPLKKEDEVIGVLELASLNKFEDYQKDFLLKVAQSIAAAVMNVQVNLKTNKLLVKSQEQAEEMRAQEEEMRQNMEELGATQEEMARVSAEMEGQLSAINKTMATIEFDLNGTILVANDNFLNLMEYNLHEIEGKHHRIFVDTQERQSEEYKKFWERLSSGENETGEFKRITKSGKEVYIKGIYNPILDQAGRPKKVLKIAYDITENKELEIQIKDQLEEAQAQEEELRQNMEELSTTQDEMIRVSTEMEGQLSAINKTMATIEFDLSGNILVANDNFLNLMEYDLHEIKGKHHKIFVDTQERQSEEYKRFWERLSRGENETGEFRRFTKSGKKVYIKGVYNPVFDQAGRPKKVLKIAYDITRTKEMELLLKAQQ